ncbi:hypothetical protein CEXT_186161 [Caerostris extrusa]|uniref:Uncharacterized protein n=1 Tax=Caerostris extrusa TaxID=172846 RepID=A0AAV4TR31_CAEEX|nr:hypothetical protein CEXT_186161 [Caerostris extrusa]
MLEMRDYFDFDTPSRLRRGIFLGCFWGEIGGDRTWDEIPDWFDTMATFHVCVSHRTPARHSTSQSISLLSGHHHLPLPSLDVSPRHLGPSSVTLWSIKPYGRTKGHTDCKRGGRRLESKCLSERGQ